MGAGFHIVVGRSIEMKLIFRSLLTAMIVFSLSACSEERRKLDETVFLDTPQLTLNLVFNCIN